MNVTPEQIIEGRDEALEYLGVGLDDWSAMAERRSWLKDQAQRSDLHGAAALTVAQAEWALSSGFGRVGWVMTEIALNLATVGKLARDDFALQA